MPDQHDPKRDRVSDLYRHNIDQLTGDDIVIASYGGAGQAIIGNILLELGLNYVDAYTERLLPDGRAVDVAAHSAYRSRLAATARAETDRRLRWPRFVKSHVPARHFADAPLRGVWVLVRDPRDALFSWYNWRRGFAEEEWDQVEGTFEEFLTRPDYGGATPVQDWADFYSGWLRAAQKRLVRQVMHFEDLKQHPHEVVSGALTAANVSVDDGALAKAVGRSSYEAMRAHEDGVVSSHGGADAMPRIMNSGRVAGWRGWITPELSAAFANPQMDRVAAQFGYSLA
ncbi:sulfotransferase domain-containing protein [Micromonospora sp. WMMD1082]|uniref:sulfotransferase domain-containing protein n=1 Tax=Micromonospora sp. WMMD1082 TaxID=3016104 RepID=UPI00241733B6|nr:sulfotransferase domain-containing protein [Micromonospora sp. WMMD1082]MDG4795540.1 sulfotransferase domain-containing protein [Micromonospora sp. WMMD1082]